jgi:TatD DNase family protein
MSLRFFDTHTHLQAPEFDGDRSETLARAREAGLAGLLVLGTDVPTSEAAIALAQAEPGVLAAAGCHPHHAAAMRDADLRCLARLAAHPSVAAVGEIGLDFYRDLSPRDKQIEVFRAQLRTAAGLAKPVAVHCRDAHEAAFPIIQAWSRRLGRSLPGRRPVGVMHYFAGDAELGLRYVELGFLISIHTSVTYPSSQRLQAVARALPLDALVVETDSPYGAPQAHRGKRNEPAFVPHAIAKIAELRREPVEHIAGATTENASRLFGASTPVPAASRAREAS